MKKYTLYTDAICEQYHLLDKDRFNIELLGGNIDSHDVNNDSTWLATTTPNYYTGATQHLEGCFPNKINMRRVLDMEMLMDLKNNNFNIPDFFYSKNIKSLFRHMSDDKKYLMKSPESARSLGQLMFRKQMFFDICNDALRSKVSADEFNEKWCIEYGEARGLEEYHKLFKSIQSKLVYVQECVPFDTEFRILIFDTEDGPKYLIKYREHYQVNKNAINKHTSEHTVSSQGERKTYVIDENNSNKYVWGFLDGIAKTKLYTYMKKKNIPAMSFDVFIEDTTADKLKYGLFECSTQFGIDSPEYFEDMSQWYTSAMVKHIEKQK